MDLEEELDALAPETPPQTGRGKTLALWGCGLLVVGGAATIALAVLLLPRITSSLAEAEEAHRAAEDAYCEAQLRIVFESAQMSLLETSFASKELADVAEMVRSANPGEDLSFLDEFETFPWPDEVGVIAGCKDRHARDGRRHELLSNGEVIVVEAP